MAYFRICPHCGAHLDPGESCTDCQEKENAVRGATNTTDSKVEKALTGPDSTSRIPHI